MKEEMRRSVINELLRPAEREMRKLRLAGNAKPFSRCTLVGNTIMGPLADAALKNSWRRRC